MDDGFEDTDGFEEKQPSNVDWKVSNMVNSPITCVMCQDITLKHEVSACQMHRYECSPGGPLPGMDLRKNNPVMFAGKLQICSIQVLA